MWLPHQAVDYLAPILDAILTIDTDQPDMGCRAEELVLYAALKAGVQGKREDACSEAQRNADEGYEGDDADDCLPPLGAEITRSNKELKLHGRSQGENTSLLLPLVRRRLRQSFSPRRHGGTQTVFFLKSRNAVRDPYRHSSGSASGRHAPGNSELLLPFEISEKGLLVSVPP